MMAPDVNEKENVKDVKEKTKAPAQDQDQDHDQHAEAAKGQKIQKKAKAVAKVDARGPPKGLAKVVRLNTSICSYIYT